MDIAPNTPHGNVPARNDPYSYRVEKSPQGDASEAWIIVGPSDPGDIMHIVTTTIYYDLDEANHVALRMNYARNVAKREVRAAHDATKTNHGWINYELETINHPPADHTNLYEAINVIEAWGLNFRLGCTVSYIYNSSRDGHMLEDLKKAVTYLMNEIFSLERASTLSSSSTKAQSK